MVLISSKKYACETCIKGHRSSACKHTDRPLFEIKKKGRPVTQCEHCRELRKTKQVHVKCICEAKEPPSPTAPSSATKKKGTPTLPAHAAFPHGVPDNLAELATSTASASDSDQGGSAPSLSGCSCKAGTGGCHCCTPRTRPGRRRSSPPPTSSSNTNNNSHSANTLPNKSPSPIIPSPCCSTNKSNPNASSSANPNRTPPLPTSTSASTSTSHPPRAPSHHILARIAELRPVLPRLSPRDAALQAQAGGQHDLFHGNIHGGNHHHAHDFSPYGRAYEHALHGPSSSEGSSGFYQQDARSAESLLSVGSLMSVGSHISSRSQGQKGAKSPREGQQSSKAPVAKSHNPRSASFDGHGQTFEGYLAATAAEQRRQQMSENPLEIDGWRLLPSLSRAAPPSGDATSFPASESVLPPTYPRSEGEYVHSDASVLAPPPPPRARSEGSFSTAAEFAVRTCGCGDGCACPGCALHNVAPASRSSSPVAGGGGQHCADAACGGACLDCTILGLTDFSSVVKFSGGPSANSNPNPNLNEDSKEGGGFRGIGGEQQAIFDGVGSSSTAASASTYPPLDPDLELELDYKDVDLDLDLELDLEGYDPLAAYGGKPEPSASYEQIDEWIREVGALPPMAMVPTAPFEFPSDSMAGTKSPFEFDPNAGGQQPPLDFAGAGIESGNAQWMFDVDVDAAIAAAAATAATASMSRRPDSGKSDEMRAQGLTGGELHSHAPTSFLSVPGPDVHRRSRSSSSASSEVSIPGAAGVRAATGLAGLSLEHKQHPSSLSKRLALEELDSPASQMEDSMAMLLDTTHAPDAMDRFPTSLCVPVPASYMDEQMLFF